MALASVSAVRQEKEKSLRLQCGRGAAEAASLLARLPAPTRLRLLRAAHRQSLPVFFHMLHLHGIRDPLVKDQLWRILRGQGQGVRARSERHMNTSVDTQPSKQILHLPRIAEKGEGKGAMACPVLSRCGSAPQVPATKAKANRRKATLCVTQRRVRQVRSEVTPSTGTFADNKTSASGLVDSLDSEARLLLAAYVWNGDRERFARALCALAREGRRPLDVKTVHAAWACVALRLDERGIERRTPQAANEQTRRQSCAASKRCRVRAPRRASNASRARNNTAARRSSGNWFASRLCGLFASRQTQEDGESGETGENAPRECYFVKLKPPSSCFLAEVPTDSVDGTPSTESPSFAVYTPVA